MRAYTFFALAGLPLAGAPLSAAPTAPPRPVAAPTVSTVLRATPAGLTGGTGTLSLGRAPAPTTADTVAVHGYRGGFYGGGFRYYGGFRPGYAYRPYYGYRPYFYGGYYRPFVGVSVGIYPRPYYYAPAYYYSTPYYYYTPAYSLYGISGGATTLPAAPLGTSPADVLPAPTPVPGDQTFPYDGGPAQPVPMPAPAGGTGTPVGKPAEGRVVSLPAAPKYAYPAYGEKPAVPAAVKDGTIAVKGTAPQR